MFKSINMKSISWMLLLALIVSCATVPLTGRRQLNLIPATELNNLSFQQYSDFLQNHKLSKNAQQTQLVKNVGKNIQKAVEVYFKQKDLTHHLRGYKWEFNLVEDKLVNAFCMPAGKVVIYTGILPLTKDEAGLATVMGHEIAHAIANHGNERMSQGLVASFGSVALDQAMKKKSAETRAIFNAAYGVGATVGVMLPFSRLHESEADRLGLIFMAMAGYDPHNAVNFWKRMAAKKGGGAPPEFLSTHPSDQTRINKIQKAMPEAMRYYKK